MPEPRGVRSVGADGASSPLGAPERPHAAETGPGGKGATLPGVAAVVVAAGRGVRFGRPKQFARLGDRTVVGWSLAAARATCGFVVLVLPPGEVTAVAGADAVVAGGATRAESVRAGLGVVAERPEVEIVVVHDAARPLASPELFRRVISAVRAGAEAVVPGLPVEDTLKLVDGSEVVRTVDREHLVRVQTPQGFALRALLSAHAQGAEGSDDAVLLERMGRRVTVVDGEAANLKITRPDDILLAEAFLALTDRARLPTGLFGEAARE